MEIVYWIIIILFFLTGIVGTIIPIIPDMFPIWIGIVIFKLSPIQGNLGLMFWIILIIITIINILADLVSNAYFVKKSGGSQYSMPAAVLGLIVGIVALPPLGILIGPFVAVLISELISRNSLKKAFKIAFSTFLAYFSSGIVKILLQLVIIFWFIIKIV